MKIYKPGFLVFAFGLFLYAAPGHCSEIGISLGSYFKASDIAQPIELKFISNSYGDFIQIIEGKNDPSEHFKGPLGVRMGERSSASFLGFTWVHKLPLRNFEVEHTLGSAFSAEKSAKPNILLYSSNLNLVLPWYPKISLWNVKPFVGLGLGYVFNFGNNFGLKIDEEEFPPELKLPYILGNNGNFQYNFGGGGKIQVWQQWWLRISLRDYILPSVKRLVRVQERGSFFSTGRDTTHNIALTFSLVHID